MHRLLTTLVALLALALPGAVQAQLFRSYLASGGSDANPCTLQFPCRLLPRALETVADAGEIWMLDSANYNVAEVSVTKSVTILAVPGVRGSVVATNGGSAMRIQAPSSSVALRNLNFVRLANGGDGIVHVQGLQLDIQDCEVFGMQGYGVFATAPNARVRIVDSVLRRNAGGIVVQAGTYATIERTRIVGNLSEGVRVQAATATISDSVISGNFSVNVNVLGAESRPTRLAIERSTLSESQGSGLAANDGNAVVYVTASRNMVSGNDIGISIFNQALEFSAMTVTLSDNVVTQNRVGIEAFGPGSIATRGNNTVHNNGTNASGNPPATVTPY